MNLSELNLNRRAINALTRNNIKTVEQLTQMKKSDIKKLRNVGDCVIRSIECALFEKGLHLADSSVDKDFFIDEYSVTEYDRIKSQMSALLQRINYLEENGKGMERYAKQGFINSHTKGFYEFGHYQKAYWDEMIKIAKGLFLNLSSPTAKWQKNIVKKQTDFRIEQAEMACEFLNKMVDLWNEYAEKAHNLDMDLLGGDENVK